MSELREEIMAANKRFMEAFKRGDPEAVAGAYTGGGRLLPPNSPQVEGPEGIREFWKQVMSLGIKSAELETLEVEGTGDGAWEQGRYTLRGAGGVMDVGKYMVIWKREGGQWKLHRDIWNSNQKAGG
jgi:ketosteroid isomerase-like protein